MCKVSDQIILCTCKAKSTESLKDYWSLHRFDKTKNLDYIGIAYFPPSFFDPENFKINNQAILSQLNESNIFDTPLLFQPKDKLGILIFSLHHCFYYKGEIYYFSFNKLKINEHYIIHFS